MTNVDRTARNPNLLVWHRRLWLIDHGAALYVQHTWRDPEEHARRPFEQIRDHVLLPFAGSIEAADERLAASLDADVLTAIAELIPDAWLATSGSSATPDPDPSVLRRRYVDYVLDRLAARRSFVTEAERVARTVAGCRSAALRSNTLSISQVVPRVERGERFIAGIIVVSRAHRFLGARGALDVAVLQALAPGCEAATVRPHLDAIERIAAGDTAAGPIARLSALERFHWLVAPSST